MNEDRLIQTQIREFIMQKVDEETLIFNEKFEKFLDSYKTHYYVDAKDFLEEMRMSSLNLFKSLDLINHEDLFDSCLMTSGKVKSEYLRYHIISQIIDNCIDKIKNNLDIFNESFKPDYYYLDKKNIEAREKEPRLDNILFYHKCVFQYISEAKGLCDRHLLFYNEENEKGGES